MLDIHIHLGGEEQNVEVALRVRERDRPLESVWVENILVSQKNVQVGIRKCKEDEIKFPLNTFLSVTACILSERDGLLQVMCKYRRN